MPCRRTQQPTPLFFPAESHGQRSLAGYSPWGLKELDMTERLNTHVYYIIHTSNCFIKEQTLSNIFGCIIPSCFLKITQNIHMVAFLFCLIFLLAFVFVFPFKKIHYIIRDNGESWDVAHSKLLWFWIPLPSATNFWICWRPCLRWHIPICFVLFTLHFQ